MQLLSRSVVRPICVRAVEPAHCLHQIGRERSHIKNASSRLAHFGERHGHLVRARRPDDNCGAAARGGALRPGRRQGFRPASPTACSEGVRPLPARHPDAGLSSNRFRCLCAVAASSVTHGGFFHAIVFGFRGKAEFHAEFPGPARLVPQVIGVFADDVFRGFHALFLLGRTEGAG